MTQKMKCAKSERLNIRFKRKIKLEFHGARSTSDGSLFAYRELDDALGLFHSASDVMTDRRTGRNIQHDITNLLRQSVYSRLAGYEDVNNVMARLLSNRILAIFFHKVDMGNIYSSDLTCSDKPLNIRYGTKVLFLKIVLLSYIKIYFFFV